MCELACVSVFQIVCVCYYVCMCSCQLARISEYFSLLSQLVCLAVGVLLCCHDCVFGCLLMCISVSMCLDVILTVSASITLCLHL